MIGAGVSDEDDTILDLMLAVRSALINTVDKVDTSADSVSLYHTVTHDCWSLGVCLG